MRFINVDSVQVEEVSSSQNPEYAILSHRWTDKEISFTEINSREFKGIAKPAKFQGALDQANQDNLRYVWIDTCCINKESSAELSEAIQSMYKWYQGAQKCYVYLEDVELDNWQVSLDKSQWFKRGWTLQELLAPGSIYFYDRKWRQIGDKTSLADKICSITGIPSEVLHTGDFSGYSVAQKMSWAADRTTTRIEDMAYCLLGLFDVTLPPLYGEGRKAFARLQKEVIQQSDDHSIFAWCMDASESSGLLAATPHCFADCRDIVSSTSFERGEPFAITNRGLLIKLEITQWSTDTYLAYIKCERRTKGDSGKSQLKRRVGIFLRRLPEDDQYVRVKTCQQSLWLDTNGISFDSLTFRDTQLFVRQGSDLRPNIEWLESSVRGFHIRENCFPPGSSLNGQPILGGPSYATLRQGSCGVVAHVILPAQLEGLRQILLGIDFDFNPICFLEDSFSYRNHPDRLNELLSRYNWSCVKGDEVEWDEIMEGGRVYRRPIMNHDGLWKLKGHRLHGLDVYLTRSTLDHGSSVSFERDMSRSPGIWKFDIDNLIWPFQPSSQCEDGFEKMIGPERLRRAVDLSRETENLKNKDAITEDIYDLMVPDPTQLPQ